VTPNASHSSWTAASAFGAHGSAVFRLLAADDYDAPNSKTIAVQALSTDAILMTSGAIDSHVAS